MNVATALNRKYLKYTGVMLASLGMNQREHVDVYLLHSELNVSDQARLKSALLEYDMQLHFLKVNKECFVDALPRNEMWSIETYYRLMLFDLLPLSIERILYLDVDMIINGDLSSVYYMPMKNIDLISCQDLNGEKTIDKFTGKQREIFIPLCGQGYQYFNAGFVLFNIKTMRERYDFAYYMKLAEEVWNYEMEAPDQDLLNYAHAFSVEYVDDEVYDVFAQIAYNRGRTVEEIRNHAVVIHYAGDKPWNTTNYHFNNEIIWWEYAKKTVFYEELLEEFVEQTIMDTTLEEGYRSLYEENGRLKESLQSLMESVNRLQQMMSV